MLVPNTPRSRLPGVFITGESRLPTVFTRGKLRLPGASTRGESRLLSVFITRSRFGHRGVVLLTFRSIAQSLKGMLFWKLTAGYFNYLGTCDLCFKKLLYPRIISDFPVYLSSGSQWRIRIIPRILRKIQNRSWTFLFRLGEVVWRKNWRRKIS